MTQTSSIGAGLVRQLARGVLAMRDFHRRGYALPYPSDAQLALDRIVLARLIEESDLPPPVGVPQLMKLCQTPLGKWLSDLLEDCGASDTVLISSRTREPTRACVEWVVSGLTEGYVDVASAVLLRLAGEQHGTWGACRDFLIRHPVIDFSSGPGPLVHSGMNLMWRTVKSLYVDVRPELCCPSCGLLAVEGQDGRGWCESENCDAFSPNHGRMDKPVKALSQEIRLSLVLAGRAEQALRASLESADVGVRMVPEPFAHAVITLPSGATCALVVRVDTQPALLAEVVRSWGAVPGVDRMVVAVPEEVMRQRADYQAVFQRHNRNGSWTLRGTRRLLTEIKAMTRERSPSA